MFIKDAINRQINSTETRLGSKIDLENSKISVDWTKEDVYNFLKIKLNLEEKILDKMKNEEIDGDALILLIKNYYKFSILKISIRKKILEYLETDIFALKNNIRENELYKEIYTENINKLWKTKKLKELKIGDKLKYIKYLIIRDPPPEIEKKDELDNYLKKIIKNEDNINEIQEMFKDLLNSDENELNEQFREWDLNDDDIFKLKIIIKLIKRNTNKSQQKKEENNANNKERANNIIKNEANLNIKEISNEKNEDIDLNNSTKQLKKEKSENINQDANSLNIIGLTPTPDEKKSDNYLFYCVVEVFTYDTSQREKAYGLRNPTEDFIKICTNFNIKFENDCSYIDYNDADNLKLSTFMLWGSEKGLKKFLKENNIEKLFIEYMKKNDYFEKAGIYLCLNTDKNIGYLIIWPGKFSYYYQKITEPNDNILLTLIRYGFSLSSNSILCFIKEELEKFNFSGYEIFQDNDKAVLICERNKIEINEDKEKTFKIGGKQFLTEGLNDVFKNKNIVNSKINQNCVFFYEHQDDNIDSQPKKEGFYELIGKLTQNESNINIFFEGSFNILDFPKEKFYSLIKSNSCYLEHKNKDEICSEQQLNDINEKKIYNLINNLNRQLDEELLNNNFYNKFECIKCKKTFKERKENFYYFEEKNRNSKKIKYVHKSCTEPKLLEFNNNSKCFVCKKKQNKSKEPLFYFEDNIYFHKSCNPIIVKSVDEIIDSEKYKIYQDLKTNIINDKRYVDISKYIQNFFEICEKKFQPLSAFKFLTSLLRITENPLNIDDKIIKKEINELKKLLFEKKNDIYGKRITQDEQKIKK